MNSERTIAGYGLEALPFWGAFAFGAVLGWFAYFTNRYRKGEVQLSDLATLLGVIGGGAVTSLFGDARTELFGAYGLGLAAGFFAYFIVLLLLVRASNGDFNYAWFLDGRRKRFDPAIWEIPAGVDPNSHPMSVGRQTRRFLESPGETGGNRILDREVRDSDRLLPEFTTQYDRAVEAVRAATSDLLAAIGRTQDPNQRARLQDGLDQLTAKQQELLAARLNSIHDDPRVREALGRMTSITSDLVVEAGRMKTATDTYTAATKVVDKVTQLVSLLVFLA
jgi:hypothetical protein